MSIKIIKYKKSFNFQYTDSLNDGPGPSLKRRGNEFAQLKLDIQCEKYTQYSAEETEEILRKIESELKCIHLKMN